MKTKFYFLLALLLCMASVQRTWAEQVTTPKVSPADVSGTPTRYLYTFTVCQAGSNKGKVWSLHDNGALNTIGTTAAKFIFESSPTDGAYYIKSVATGKYLFRAGDNSGSTVELSTSKSLWYVVKSTSGENYANTVKICPTAASDAVGVNSNNLYYAAQGGNGNSWWIMDETSEAGANYTISIIGVPEGRTATVTYNGIAYSNGATNVLVLGTPASVDFTASVIEGYTSNVSISGTTVTVTYTDYITPRSAEYQSYLDLGGKVGYPSTTSDGYTYFKAAYDEFVMLPTVEKCGMLQDMETKLAAYKAETNLTMPEVGKVYTLKHVIDAKSDATKYHWLTSGVIGQSTCATMPTVESHTGQTHYWMAATSADGKFTLKSNANQTLQMNFHDNVNEFSLAPGTTWGRVSLVKGSATGYRICMKDDGTMNNAYKATQGKVQAADWSSDWIIEEATGYIYTGTAMGDIGNLTGSFTHTKSTETTVTLGGFMVLPDAAEASEFSVTPTVTQSGDTHINIENSVAANYHNVYWSYGTIATTEGEASHPEWINAGTNLAKAGLIGYPKKTCASYLALKNAYDHINSGNNTTITIGYFDHLYNNYLAETDIVVPAAGKVYGFRTDFQGTTTNRYLTDTNDGYDKNPVNGHVNGLAMTEQTQQTDDLRNNGIFWKCENVTGEGAIFTSSMGNILGNRVIASSMNKVQRLVFGRGSEFGKMSIRLGKNGKYLSVWNDKDHNTGTNVATSMDVCSTIGKVATYTTDWIITDVEAVGDHVYFVNVTSDKPSTYEDVRNDVVVKGTYNSVERETSGLGFFVGTEKVIGSEQLSVNNLSTDFYQSDAAVEANRPTVAFNHDTKTIDVHYTFNYATAVSHIYAEAVTLNSKEGFGWPKATKTGDVYDVAAKQTFATAIKDFETANKEGENWKAEALDEAHYNTLHNAILAYKGNISDNDIVLPQNGKPVLMINVFTNTNTNDVYTNYTYNENLTLKFAGANCTTQLPASPTKSYLWAVQRDDEKTVTTISDVEKSRTEYTGSDKWTDRVVSRTASTQDAYNALTVSYDQPVVTETVTEAQMTKVTTDEKWSTVLDANKIKTKANARFSGGSEHIENSYVDLNGTYVEIHTYDRDCIVRTQTQTAARKMSEGENPVPLFWTNAQKTATTTDATEYPAYEAYGEAVATYQLVRYNVTEKAYNVQTARRYPSYYLSAIDGEGYIGRTSVSDGTAKMTDKHSLQFNVVFTRGTELGTVGILFLLNDANPRYICGNLNGTKFDRYQIQYGYDTEGATAVTGVWSTDWGFVQASLAQQESHPVGEGPESTGTWDAPKLEGQVIKFYASNTTPTTAAEQITDTQNSYGATNLPFAVSLPASAVQHVYIITGATRIWKDGVKTARTTLKWEDVKESLKVTIGSQERYILPREFPVLIHHNTDVKYYYCPTDAFAAYATAEQIAAVNAAKAKNVLNGTLGKKNVPAGEQPYILAKTAATNFSDGKTYQTVAFYKMESGYQLPANRIYIDMNTLPIENDGETEETVSSARSLNGNKRGGIMSIDIEIDELGNAFTEEMVTTTIVDILDEGENDIIYDLSGRKIKSISGRGFYIKNGKKYIVK